MRWTTAPRSASSSSRGEQVTPQQAGLPNVGSRRVPGLRRGEVATLTGVNVEYYAKLERGALAGASATIRDAIARALQLDEAERAHLFDLAQAADGTSALMLARWRTTKRWTSPPDPRLSATAGLTCSPRITPGRAMHSSLYASDPAGRRTWPALCPPRPVKTKQSAEMTPMRLAPDQGKL
jgi:transcriptional regulator with XRE-family HTH domain